MRPNIQRLELAKLDGYTPHPSEDYRWRYKGKHDDYWISEDCLPDYLYDLNVLRELELGLTVKQHKRYRFVLCCAVGMSSGADMDQVARNYISASAAHRSEALLRTFDKWKED